MTSCYAQKSASINQSDIDKINQFTRKKFTEDELYIFNVTLCNNDIDRDYERFSVNALNQLKELFVGKTGICDHSMKSANQKARIFDTYVEKQDGKFTTDNQPLYALKAKAYMVRNEENQSFITEIDAGIKKEVSVSCSMKSSICSICGKDKRSQYCEHINGKSYNDKLAFATLDDATDAYEWSFVAVPAQKDAGVTKSFNLKGDVTMDNIIKTIKECQNDVTLTKAQADQLAKSIDTLKEQAKIGEEYKSQLVKEVTKLCGIALPEMDIKTFGNVANVMTTKELIAFRDTFAKTVSKSVPSPQIAHSNTNKQNKIDYSQFKI